MSTSDNDNIFRAPSAPVHDYTAPDQDAFIPEGSRVPPGHGLTWLSEGWALFRRAPGLWIGITLVFVLVMVILGRIPVLNVLVNLLMPVFIGGILLGCRALHRGEALAFAHLFAGFDRRYLGKLVLVGILYLAGVIAVSVTLGLVAAVSLGIGMDWHDLARLPAAGVVTLILLGLTAAALIMPLAMALWYAPALVVLHGVAPFEAMKTSFFVTLRNFLPFLVYGLVYLVLAIAASLPLGLGWLVLTPVTFTTLYASYRDMFIREGTP